MLHIWKKMKAPLTQYVPWFTRSNFNFIQFFLMQRIYESDYSRWNTRGFCKNQEIVMLLLDTHRILYISRNLGGADWCRNLGNKVVTYNSDNTYVQGESRLHVARMNILGYTPRGTEIKKRNPRNWVDKQRWAECTVLLAFHGLPTFARYSRWQLQTARVEFVGGKKIRKFKDIY
jgi:hypothetical protein